MTANVERWRSLVMDALTAQASPVPPGMVLAIIEAESSGTPSAYRGEAAINDGSIGLMQVLYATARGEGYGGPPGDKGTLSGLFDPATNITYGVKFLTGLWNRLGNVADVASAYNGGVRPWLGFGGTLPLDSPPVTICLARDAQGNCIQRHTVKPGEYGNADYVNKVLRLTQQYSGATALPPVTVTGSPDGFTTTGILVGVTLLGVAALAMMKR